MQIRNRATGTFFDFFRRELKKQDGQATAGQQPETLGQAVGRTSISYGDWRDHVEGKQPRGTTSKAKDKSLADWVHEKSSGEPVKVKPGSLANAVVKQMEAANPDMVQKNVG